MRWNSVAIGQLGRPWNLPPAGAVSLSAGSTLDIQCGADRFPVDFYPNRSSAPGLPRIEEIKMADNTSGSASGGLYFIVGGLVVAGIAAFLYFNGYVGGHVSKTVEQTTITAPDHHGAETTTTTTTEKSKP